MGIFISDHVQYDFKILNFEYDFKNIKFLEMKFHWLFPEKQSLDVTPGNHLVQLCWILRAESMRASCQGHVLLSFEHLSLYPLHLILYSLVLWRRAPYKHDMGTLNLFSPDCAVPTPSIPPHTASVPVP